MESVETQGMLEHQAKLDLLGQEVLLERWAAKDQLEVQVNQGFLEIGVTVVQQE
jgi:hypothetical protein